MKKLLLIQYISLEIKLNAYFIFQNMIQTENLVYMRYDLVPSCIIKTSHIVVLLFYVHGKHLRSCRDGQLT